MSHVVSIMVIVQYYHHLQLHSIYIYRDSFADIYYMTTACISARGDSSLLLDGTKAYLKKRQKSKHSAFLYVPLGQASAVD